MRRVTPEAIGALTHLEDEFANARRYGHTAFLNRQQPERLAAELLLKGHAQDLSGVEEALRQIGSDFYLIAAEAEIFQHRQPYYLWETSEKPQFGLIAATSAESAARWHQYQETTPEQNLANLAFTGFVSHELWQPSMSGMID
jgi:hypothetical protein